MDRAAIQASMKSNRRRDTKPELVLRHQLYASGFRGYRLQWKVPGHPDVSWPGKKVAIFVNGCFWHQCPYCKPPLPKTNVGFWTDKFAKNKARDRRVLRELRAMGWKTHVIWECQLQPKKIDRTLGRLLPKLAVELGRELRV